MKKLVHKLVQNRVRPYYLYQCDPIQGSKHFRMPGLGGLDVIRRIKQTRPNLAVVLISGHGSREDLDEGRRLGAFDYLQKPVDIDDLVDIIQRAATATRPGGGDG